jgi:hydroxymethylbilane synthase
VLDAILLACAGLERLGIAHHITQQLGLQLSLPAVGQGVIGIECRSDDTRSRAALAALHHADTYTRLLAERSFAATLGGSCHSPIAAHAVLDGSQLTVHGFIGAPDGGETYRDQVVGAATAAESLGHDLARRMQAAGAETLLERLRQEAAAIS